MPWFITIFLFPGENKDNGNDTELDEAAGDMSLNLDIA